MNGSITARVVEIRASAKVVADVNHESLAVEAGAYLQGLRKRPNAQAGAEQPEALASRSPLHLAEVRSASADGRQKAAG